jgi:hypothetical protein
MEENYPEIEVYYDQQDPSLNSSVKHRADIRIVTEHRTIIVEVDEHQHDLETYACQKKVLSNILAKDIEKKSSDSKKEDRRKRVLESERGRMSNIACSGDITNYVFIRFNPDKWEDENGKLHPRKKKIPEERLEFLTNEIESWLDIETVQSHIAMVIYLFYNGSERSTDFIPVDPEEVKENDNKRIKL